METLIGSGLEHFAKTPLAFIIYISIAGCILILFNIVSSTIAQKIQKRSVDQILFEHSLSPVINAAGSLISRISDILVTHSEEFQTEINSIGIEKVESSLESTNRAHTAIWRLCYLLYSVEQFRRATKNLNRAGRLKQAEYFLYHKFRVGLRGYLYGSSPILPTEHQVEIGARLSDLSKSENLEDISLGKFSEWIVKDGLLHTEIASVQKLFSVSPVILSDKDSIITLTSEWSSLIALAHFNIYLIDFFQELEKNCQWEEYRAFCVALVCDWNKSVGATCYLYEPKDLSTGNYLDSFPAFLAPAGFFGSLVMSLLAILNLQNISFRVYKYLKLSLRGHRFVRRHDKKSIFWWGIRIYSASAKYDIQTRSKSAYLVRQASLDYINSRLPRKP